MKFIILTLILLPSLVFGGFTEDCLNAKTQLGFTYGDLSNPFAFTKIEMNGHHYLKCEERSTYQRFVSLSGYAKNNVLGCAVYDPESGKSFSDWFYPGWQLPKEQYLKICIKQMKEKVLRETISPPRCGGMKFACLNENEDGWKCCNMGNH